MLSICNRFLRKNNSKPEGFEDQNPKGKGIVPKTNASGCFGIASIPPSLSKEIAPPPTCFERFKDQLSRCCKAFVRGLTACWNALTSCWGCAAPPPSEIEDSPEPTEEPESTSSELSSSSEEESEVSISSLPLLLLKKPRPPL